MKFIKLILFFVFFSFSSAIADTPYFIDFKYVLNESVAGKKAQKDLKNQLEKGLEQLKSKEKKVQEKLIR